MNTKSKTWHELIDDVLLPFSSPEHCKHDNLFDEILKDLGAYNSSSGILEKVEEGFCLHIDLPGAELHEIKMNVDEDGIRVKAERKGYRATTYEKSYALPKGTDLEKVRASLKCGVLKITLPQREVKKSKSVKIEFE